MNTTPGGRTRMMMIINRSLFGLVNDESGTFRGCTSTGTGTRIPTLIWPNICTNTHTHHIRCVGPMLNCQLLSALSLAPLLRTGCAHERTQPCVYKCGNNP